MRLSPRNLTLASAALAACGLILWTASRGSAPPRPATLPAPAAANEPPAGRPVTTPVERSAVEAEPAPPDPEALSSGVLVSGRAVDATGAPVRDLAIAVHGEENHESPEARTGEDGAFRLRVDSLPCLLAAADRGWTTLRFGEVLEDEPEKPSLVVVAPVVAMAGVVVERSGAPLPGARLELRLDPEILAALPGDASEGLHGDWTAASGTDGRFVLERAPATLRARLRTSLQGWRADERTIAVPPQGQPQGQPQSQPQSQAGGELRIVLEPDDPTGPILEGIAVHADGRPAAGAVVSFGSARARADAGGAFRFACGWFDERTPLVAALRGFQPAVVPAFGARADPLARSLPPERIVLPGPELAIEGRVLGPDGTPQKSWRVAIEEGTALDPGGSSRDWAEELSGAPLEVRTYADGRFRITGLAARSYTLLAFGRGLFPRVESALRSDPLPAGSSGVEMRVTEDQAPRALRGRVLALSGDPVPGALLGLGRPVRPGAPGEFSRQGRFRASTDADGRFEIGDAPAGLVFLVAGADSMLPARIALAADGPRGEIEIRLGAARTLTLDANAAAPPPDGIRALARDGSPAPIWSFAGTVPLPSGLARLAQGRSGALAVGEEASGFVLYRGPVELGRIPLPPGRGAIGPIAWP